MKILLWFLIADAVVSSSLFFILVLRLGVEDMDAWLRPMAGALLLLTSVIGVAALATGYFAGKNLEDKVVKEQLTRLRLEETISPRRFIKLQYGETGESSADPLSLFKGVDVEIVALPDAEPRRLAKNIRQVLYEAGWTTSLRFEMEERFANEGGVFVESAWDDKPDRGTEAARAITAFLMIDNVEATRIPAHFALPRKPDSLKIFIGLKPDLYFDDKWTTEMLTKGLPEAEKEKFSSSLTKQREERQEAAKREVEALWKRWGEAKATPQQK
jgi:hypothetical protein